ncbi:conserved hypothetical protein [Theileria orientalis strain Shintoku]|uniref:Signal peptide containing protein n=1 Tax=Theileria orientalis strain Shintoku TaxID=869250 RepID=J4CDE9_THEOR|nr:LOW QUALITY PROTEIN: conserved hypothetical protein [Theileria orientalis strain Shintoku]BAM41022.1 conserved hypothetical protein [Theileria orientalis strain Shintoku]|eukprot:XP_009691323.1 LOW QUALITY PROTEIN: conserved hypothetical protein [Theileria orientalis strain Shintoku]
MKILALLMCIAVQRVISRPITLMLPCDEIDLQDINITTKGQILVNSATQIYEATEGNMIHKIMFYNQILYSAERNDTATMRKVFVEATKTDTLMAIETKYPNGLDMQYFRIDGHDAIKITFLQTTAQNVKIAKTNMKSKKTKTYVWRAEHVGTKKCTKRRN